MDKSKEASKSTLNDLNDDIKVFVKLAAKGDNLTSKRVFFFEENRENLLLQKERENGLYKYDYIFSDYDNALLIASTLNPVITQLIRNEKNILFLTLGEFGLGITKFLFGYSSGNLMSKDSYFNYAYLQILKDMKNYYPYDNILIEIYKISNEKFILDYKEIVFNPQNTIIDDINEHIKAGHKSGMTSSSIATNELLIGAGHSIIRLKFFKYMTEDDISKSQREVEIIRSFTFIDIEAFSSDFTKAIINKNVILPQTDPKNYSLMCFKKFIESIANQDLAKFGEISSTLTDVLTEIFSIQNLFSFIFGFIDEYESSIMESKLTLDLLTKCKSINNNTFYNYLQEMNISLTQLGNGAVKEEFQILDMILSEIIFYIEKTFLHSIKDNTLNTFYENIKDLDLQQKYFYLKTWLIKSKYDFILNKEISFIFDYIAIYYKSRARWKCLIKARDTILQLTSNLKETPVSNKDQLNDKTEDNIISEFLPNISSYIDMYDGFSVDISKDIKHHENKDDFLNKVNDSSNGNAFKSTRRSIESSFSHKIFKDFNRNLRITFNGIFRNFTEEKGCLNCETAVRNVIPYDYSKIVGEYKSLSLLQTGINLDKISAISKNNIITSNKNKSIPFKTEDIFLKNNKFDGCNINITKRIDTLNTKFNQIQKKYNI